MTTMKITALFLWVFLASFVSSAFSVSADSCQEVVSRGLVSAGVLERCGDQLRSFALTTTDPRWRQNRDMHGVFYFTCMNEPKEPSLLDKFSRDGASMGTPCPDEPGISGSFIAAEKWQQSNKDESAILDAWEGNYWQILNSIPRPSAVCPAFDVSMGGLAGRATCAASGNSSAILAVFADDHVGFWIAVSQEGKTPEAVKDKMRALTRQFTIERGTGDAALLRWMQ